MNRSRSLRESLAGTLVVAALLCLAGPFAPAPASATEDGDTGRALEILLLAAAAEGRADVLRDVLAAGTAPDAADPDGWTPLLYALSKGHGAVARQLLDAGADPNRSVADGPSPLVLAVGRGDAASLRALVERGADPNIAGPALPLHVAIQKRDAAMVAALLAAGADPAKPERDGATPLVRAVAANDVAIATALLDAGADPGGRAGAVTPLGLAVAKGSAAMVALLVAAGADPNDLAAPGMTAIDLAQRLSLGKPITAWLEPLADAKASLVATGRSPETLALAIAKGDPAEVSRHLQAGVSPDATTPEGWSMLGIAAFAGNGDAMNALVDAGGDLLREGSPKGYPPYLIAIFRNHEEMLSRMRELGASPSVDVIERARKIARAQGDPGLAQRLATIHAGGDSGDERLVREIKALLTARGFDVGRVSGDYDEPAAVGIKNFRWALERDWSAEVSERVLHALREHHATKGPVGGLWGAVGVDRDAAWFTGKYMHETSQEAEEQVRKKCEDAGRSCAITPFQDHCFALARAGLGFGYRFRRTMAEAADAAMASCRQANPQGCALSWGFCTDGSFGIHKDM